MKPLPLDWIVNASWRMSVVIVALWCARPLLRRFAGSGTVAGLWLLAAMGLLLPWPVAARWNLPASWFAAADAVAPSAWTVRADVQDAPGARTGNAASNPPAATVLHERNERGKFLGMAYLAGLTLALARLVGGWWLTRRRVVPSASADGEARLARAFAEILPALRRNVAVRLTDALGVPALAGVWRPCIWMPRLWLHALDDTALRHVLLHELGHARRRDLLAQWLCALAASVHWFNPLAWLLARAARTDRELACDAWVLTHGETGRPGEGFGVAYGRTLIRVAARPSTTRPVFGVVAMAVGQPWLSLRVREIGGFRACAPWRGIVAGGLAAGLAVAVATVGNAAPTPEPAASPSLAASPSGTATPAPAAADPAGSGQPSVEVSAKFIEFSGEALRSLRDQPAKTQGRVKELLDRVVAVSVGKNASTANFAITQLLPRKDYETLIRTLNQLKGVDLLSSPRVTTRSGQKATIEIIREFIYPTGLDRTPGADGKVVPTPKKFDKKNTGVTLSVEPEIAPARDVVDLNVSWQLVSLEGWVRMSDGQPVAPADHAQGGTQPVFVTQAVESFISVPTDSVLVLGSLRQHPGTWYYDFSHQAEPAKTEAIILTFISLDLVKIPPLPPEPASSAAPSPTPAPAKGKSDLPYGVPVPGKPGYVTSPYAPDAGYVDLHGFERDAEVRDPYTGKMFLVP